MKKILVLIILVVFSASCVSKKVLIAKELEVSNLKRELATNEEQLAAKEKEAFNLQKELDNLRFNGLLDSDGDGVIDKYDVCPNLNGGLFGNGCPDSDGDGVSNIEDRCPDVAGTIANKGCPEVSEGIVKPDYIRYFQTLKPTRSVILNKYFKKGISLKDSNAKLIKVLKEKLNIEDGHYKYFAIDKDNYAIITKKECITKEGEAIRLEQCKPENDCQWYQLSCVEEGYSRFYLFLVTKKIMGEDSPGFNESEFKKLYETHDLDSNWRAIPKLKELLTNTNNLFTDDYSVVIKLFQIKKEGNFGEPRIERDPTYEFETQIKGKFQPNTAIR